MQQDLLRLIERLGLRRQTRLEQLEKRNDWLRELMMAESENVEISLPNENSSSSTNNSVH